jgi:ABC-type lipoprotein export system ATPase subunit
MQLHIQQLLPVYFPESRKESSEIWGKDLVFEKGEYIKIVAPSGKGKTSFMHFVYGLRKDYSGRIRIDGSEAKDLSQEDLAATRKSRLSMVFQDLRLFPGQTVWENLEIKRQLDPFHPKEKINEFCRRLGIGDKLDARMSSCSYGEQQRVSIVRALLQPFDFLLLDEPFSHLDENNSQLAMELIVEESKKRQAGIIFADLERIDYFPFTRLFHL